MPEKCLRYNHQAGAALIEFAIIVPLLLLLVVGVSEFAYAFYHLNMLNKSVQDGARYFSDPLQARKGVSIDVIDVNPATNATNIATTRNLIIFGKLDGTAPTLLCNPLRTPPCDVAYYNTPTISVVGAGNNHIQVTAVYNHNFMLGNVLNNFTALGISNPFPLTASTVLRVEGGT
ncbi:MAG: TadE/TadG family type IV pilus assembly protein [Methylococcaceae bacterium]